MMRQFALWLLVLLAFTGRAQLPAFPGAEGFGALASGGRYGDVYHVTSLGSSSSTPGTFAYGLATAPTSGRTIVFDISGYIPVSGNLGVYQNNLTIAGQSAPGDGVGLKGGTFWIEKTNVVVRHFRFRDGVSADALDMSVKTTNAIIDHCDTLFSTDENFSSFNSPPENMTFQWSFNAWGLLPHSAGGLWYVNHATSHHSLWAHNHTRDPKALPSGLLDWVNNITFDYGIGFILGDSTVPADYRANVENNYFICPPGNTRPYALSRSGLDTNGAPTFSLYLTNCLWDTDGDYILDGYDHGTGMLSVTPGSLVLKTNAFARTAGIPVTQDSALVAYKKIVSQGGPLRLDANHPNGLRDEVATELIRTLVTQQNDVISSVAATGASNGGYGTLNSTPAPTDTDRDGMPDFWETALGSNPNLDDHTNQVPAGAFVTNNPAGYTLLEEYLHFRATPHAVLGKSVADNLTSQDVDLRSYTSGFTNKAPVTYTIANVSTGTVTLVGGNVAHYEPPTNYFGRASFNFTVTDGDGSSWTQPFLLLVSATAPPRNLIWKGDGTTNSWNATALNFLNGTNTVSYRDGDNATFSDSGSVSPYLKLASTLTPFSVTVSGAANYIFGSTGSLAGAMALVKSGPSTLTISNANTFSGGTSLDGGRVVFGNKSANSSALGTGGVDLGGAATIELYGASAGDIDSNGVGAFTNAINIASGETGSFLAPFRYTLSSALTGDGTFNLRVNGVRGDVTGNFSAFTGAINVTSLSGTTDFRVANTAGFPSAQLNLAPGVLMYSRTTSGATISIGEFSASAGAIVSAGVGGGSSAQNDVTWRVGGLNTDATNGASFQGTVKVIKQGAGVWTLTGSSTTTGATTVSNGTLVVSGTLAASPVTVASNAVLTGSGILGGGATILPGGNLVPPGSMTFSNKLALVSANCFFDLSSSPAGGNDQIVVRGGLLALTNTQNFFFNLTDGFLGPGTYVLIDGATNTVSSAPAFASNLPIGSRQNLSFATPPGQVLLNVTGNVASLVWRGTNGSAWDTITTNWLNAGSADAFWLFDALTFDDSSTNGVVNLIGSVQPRSVLVSNVSRAYGFNGGSLDGTTGLIKQGGGTLTLSATNNFSGGTFLNGGMLVLGSTAANSSALGTNAVTLNGGTLQMYGYGLSSTPDYGSFGNDLIVNTSGTLRVPPRATIASRLTGRGTLNVVDDYVRADFAGDWSAFMGQINIGPRSGGCEFRIANGFGYGAAAMFLSNGITAYPTADNATVEIGELAGAANAVLGPGNGNGTNPTWLVGGKNTSATFAGSIRDAGVTTVIKTGNGAWALSGSNSFSGGIIVSNGTLLVNNTSGSGTGSGAVEVLAGATLGGNGIIAGPVKIETDGALSPGTSIGKLTISNSLTLSDGSTTVIEVNKLLGTNDAVVCSGAISFDGELVVTNLAGTLAAGDSFKIFGAASYIGDFAAISGSPGAGLAWDFNPTNGVLSVISVVAPPASLYSATISFPGYNRAEVLTNIPLLVVLSTNIPGFSYAQFDTTNAGDLRFTTTNGETELNYELDTWNPSGQSRVWVQVPLLMSNTVIRASWGNNVLTNPPAASMNGATWSTGYVGVWHLATSGINDSTMGAHAANLNSSALTNGLIGDGAYFNGTSAAVQVPWSADFDMASNFEVQGWFKVTAVDKPASGNFLTLSSKEATANFNNRNWWLALRSDGRLWWKSSTSIDATNSTDLADGAWHFFSAIHDGAAARLYIDGVQAAVDATPGTANTQTAPVFFGNEDGTSRYHKGFLDEMRVSNVPRSSNWVWAVYQNIASNTVFNSVSPVMSTSVPGTNITATLLANSLRLTWPADHIGWRLQVQTNTLLSTGWVDVPGATMTNQITIPVNPSMGGVFYRMIFP